MKRIHIRDSKGTTKEVYVSYATSTRKGSILCNPFRPKSYNTVGFVEATEKYRRWLWKLIRERNKPILRALAQLGPDSVLVCHAHTNQPSHADVIIKAWLYCWEQGIIPAPVTPWSAPDHSKRSDDSLFLVRSTHGRTAYPLPTSATRVA